MGGVMPAEDTCYRAVAGRDRRFDGWFFTAVTSTGIYCRPSCPARTPGRHNVRFFPTAAGAQRHGFRACKRCRPDASPGSPDWDVRADLTGRALRLIADGVVDRDGVDGLARRLGYSVRQLHRSLTAEVGAGPLALARAQRARTARVLLETTALPAAQVAFAAGFASIRQFNDTIREVFASSPLQLRAGRTAPGSVTAGALELRLAYREPLDVVGLLRWHGLHAVAGIERFDDDALSPVLTQTLALPHAPGRVALSPGEPGWVRARVELTDHRDLAAAVTRVRRMLDLDADPISVDAALAVDADLAPLVATRPGLRSPGAVDGAELAVRTVIGQQVSLRGARAVAARIVAQYGTQQFADDPSWVFPSVQRLAEVDPATLPMPRARGRTVVRLAQALAAGEVTVDAGADRVETRAGLMALPGIGPWTADYIAMRALGDPDILLSSDLAVRRVATQHAIDLTQSQRWAPWRSYVTQHLWAVALDALPATHPSSATSAGGTA